MPVSRRTMVMKHVAAMQLILSMQDSGTGELINVTYVRDKGPKAPSDAPANMDDLRAGLERLQDLLMLVDAGVYTAYNKLLRGEGGIPQEDVEAAIKTNSRIYQSVTDNSDASLWCGGDVHPSTFILREVVSALLA